MLIPAACPTRRRGGNRGRQRSSRSHPGGSSGIGQPGQPWTVASNRGIVRTTIDAFGVERCMFASNFPVDSVCADFGTIFNGFSEIVRDFSPVDRSALFHDNAIRIYAIE